MWEIQIPVNKRTWKKWEMRIWYESHPKSERKVPFATFMQRVYKWVPKERAISVEQLTRNREAKTRHKEREWYNSYKGEKCDYRLFLWRLNFSDDWEWCIDPNKRKWGYVDHWNHKQGKLTKELHSSFKKVIPDSYYVIEITYSPEEAKVFKKVYLGMIEELQTEYEQEEIPAKALQIQEKLDKITKEYEVFLNFNK